MLFPQQAIGDPYPITTTAEVWSNGALDPWSGMGVYPKNSKGPEGPMVQEINEETRYVVNNGNRTKSGSYTLGF